jgi:quercetin dioxygenase-like cupin family protein
MDAEASPKRLAYLALAGIFLISACALRRPFSSAPSTSAAAAADQAIVISPATLKFTSLPGAPSCLTAAVLRGDPATGPSVMLQRLTAGCRVPWHWHTPDEQVMVVNGTGKFEMKGAKPIGLQPGAYAFLPGHHVHRGSCASACTLFASADGVFDIHYVDEAGNEIPAVEALKRSTGGHAKKTTPRKP